MTTTASDQRRGGWLILLLAAVLAFAAMAVLGTTNPSPASAATASTARGSSEASVSAAQIRVGASTSDLILLVGGHDGLAAGQCLGEGPSQSCLVSGHCVAAEAGDAAATTAGKELTTYYPPNRGFLGASSKQTLEAGTRIDRYGGEGGHFASPAGTPIEMRALSPGARSGALNTYEVVTPFETDAGTVAPWFGQLGLGTQYDLPASVAELLEGGFLKAVP